MTALPAEAGDGAYDETAAAAAAAAAAAPAPARVRRRGLHVVPAMRRSSAPLAPFVVVVAAFLVLGLVALLGLNTLLAQDAFRIHDLEQSNARLAEREQALERRLTALESPATLAERAEDLGMVPSRSPLFLRLPDGAVLGSAPEAEQGSADPDALAAVEAAGQGSRQAPTTADGGDAETEPDPRAEPEGGAEPGTDASSGTDASDSSGSGAGSGTSGSGTSGSGTSGSGTSGSGQSEEDAP